MAKSNHDKMLKILVVSYHQGELDFFTNTLENVFGVYYEYDVCANIPDAKKLIEENHYDACLVDDHPETQDGIKLISLLSEKYREIPFILISNVYDCEADINAMRAGATEYLEKRDISPVLLERVIRHSIIRKRDENQLRHIQQFLLNLINNIPSPVFLKDNLFQFILVNDSFCGFVGKQREDIIGQKEGEILQGQPEAEIERLDSKVLINKSVVYNEFKLNLGKANLRDVIIKKTFLKDFMGEEAIVGIIDDVTESKEKERELREKGEKLLHDENKLRHLNATKDKLFSIISHDLRNPIGSIGQLAEMLMERNDLNDETKNALLFDLRDLSKSTSDLLENLLMWSWSQQGKIIPKPNNINVGEIIYECYQLLKSLADKKEISIQITSMDGMNAYADRDMVRLVLRNLISNAIKFTRQNGLINVHVLEKNGMAIIIVKDNGIGIDDKKVHVFGNNNYESTYGTGNEKGSGLGLYLCKEFVEANNGKIWYTSTFGKGSEFSFSLPKA